MYYASSEYLARMHYFWSPGIKSKLFHAHWIIMIMSCAWLGSILILNFKFKCYISLTRVFFFQFCFIPRFLLVQIKKKKNHQIIRTSCLVKQKLREKLDWSVKEKKHGTVSCIVLTHWINSVCMAYTVRRNCAFIFRNRISIVETNPIVYRRPKANPRSIVNIIEKYKPSSICWFNGIIQ